MESAIYLFDLIGIAVFAVSGALAAAEKRLDILGFILFGTILGMMFTSIIGIYIGVKFGKKLDEFYIKTFSSIIFIIFGFVYATTTTNLRTTCIVLICCIWDQCWLRIII